MVRRNNYIKFEFAARVPCIEITGGQDQGSKLPLQFAVKQGKLKQLKRKQGKLHKETSSCSLAALVVETACAISTFLCAPHVVSHVTCTCSFVCLLLLLRCVHSVSACHDQSVLPYASW